MNDGGIDDIEFGESAAPAPVAGFGPGSAARRKSPEVFLQTLRRRLESKGLDWDRLPKQTTLDTPPACFLFRARGDKARALIEWHAWLSQAAETDDIPYRYDQPGDANFCIDCTPAFRGEARAAGACSFANVQFESRVYLGEREIIGVSRSPEVPPAGQYMLDGMVVPFESMPKEIQDYHRARGVK